VLSAANPAMKLMIDHKGGRSSIITPECLKNSYGSYYLSLDFEKVGGLDHLTAGYDTAEN
jgi:hypothetical protein